MEFREFYVPGRAGINREKADMANMQSFRDATGRRKGLTAVPVPIHGMKFITPQNECVVKLTYKAPSIRALSTVFAVSLLSLPQTSLAAMILSKPTLKREVFASRLAWGI